MTPTQYRELIEMATEGPWTASRGTSCSVRHTDWYICPDPRLPDGLYPEVFISVCDRPLGENAKLIAQSRNLAPHLLALWEAVAAYDTADPMVRGEAYRDVQKALADLEAAQ